MEEMDKVSGGANGPIERLSNIMNQAGIAPEVYSLPQNEAVRVMCHRDQHGLSEEYRMYTNPLYNIFGLL